MVLPPDQGGPSTPIPEVSTRHRAVSTAHRVVSTQHSTGRRVGSAWHSHTARQSRASRSKRVGGQRTKLLSFLWQPIRKSLPAPYTNKAEQVTGSSHALSQHRTHTTDSTLGYMHNGHAVPGTKASSRADLGKSSEVSESPETNLLVCRKRFPARGETHMNVALPLSHGLAWMRGCRLHAQCKVQKQTCQQGECHASELRIFCHGL